MNKLNLLMKVFTNALCAILFLGASLTFAQTNRVLVSVNWPSNSFQNKVEVYDPANNMLVSICNDNDCYNTTGSKQTYVGTYDLGCLATDPVALPNYYIKIYNANNTAWSGSASVTVNVAGVDMLTDNGANASTAGHQIDFNVDSTAYCNLPDTDGDFVIDYVDLDDDNDGILDTDEGLGLDNFNCQVPSLVFRSPVLEVGNGTAVGSIYRFNNSIEGYDILAEITEVNNATLESMDDDGVNIADNLQSQILFSGSGVPYITFKFTIVDDNTNTPSATIFRIGGTTWDVDGGAGIRESVRYFNPSAYGLDNPSSLTIDNYVDGAGVTGSYTNFPGFDNSTVIRSYFQFLSNTFSIRMQARKDDSSSIARLFMMSFTQCDIFDFKAPTLTILNGQDTDGDGINNDLDLDSDNDGIPDNVEAQSTLGYVAPSGTLDYVTGVDTAYANGLGLEDTDADNIPDFMDFDADNDGILDIDENGIENDAIVTFIDDDHDGLDNNFETNGTTDAIWDVNEDIEVPSASILPDTDGDLALGGDLDYRDVIDTYFPSATIDFDGVDDYVQSSEILDLSASDFTLSAWIKLDDNNGNFSIMGRSFGHATPTTTTRGISIEAQGGGTSAPSELYLIIRDDTTRNVIKTNTNAIPKNVWVHVSATYDGTNVKLYINGELLITEALSRATLPDLSGIDFTIGAAYNQDGTATRNHFDGTIDEVRVFDMALTDDQIQRMVYQEIEQIGSNVQGSIIDKDIIDISTSTAIPWANLQAYYPMTDIVTSRTLDYSNYGNNAVLHNITTVQSQTAPMPYETVSDGDWTQEATWLHGDVWDYDSMKNWSIVKINNDVTTSSSRTQLGMVIEDGKTLTVNGNSSINNTWYLELNGTLDLQSDSQLRQTVNSDLVTDFDGKILRRQEGSNNYYWYNYWSSPVGTTTTTALTDNNTSSNNDNNTPFSINMLKDGSNNALQFTSAYHEAGKISTYWLYTFQNGLTYWDWSQITPSSAIQPGVGYSQKGTGNAGTEQQYIFEGKPNNGTILVNADDVDGDSANESEDNITYTSTLIGNPYPSALDARQFINDNAGIINGTILLWEQWAGSTHYLAEYQGGYGYINSVATERAYQHADIPIADQVQTQGIKTPTFYIPVAQGFFVEVIEDGNIEFNNGQRAVRYEGSGQSVFFRTEENGQASTNEDEVNPHQLIRLEFETSEGATRRFVIAFDADATDTLDYGKDGGLIQNGPEDDIGNLIDGKQYVIQTTSSITPDKEVDLILKSSGNFNYSIKTIEILNIDDAQDIFLRDNLTSTYHDLRSSTPYGFISASGTFNERFSIVFQNGDTLSNNSLETDSALVYLNNIEKKLYAKGLNGKAKQLTLTNMLGQTVKTITNANNKQLENGLDVSSLSSSVYLVNISLDNNKTITKKVIIN